MTPTETQFRLRIPNDLHAKLVENAEKNHRSINAEVIARIVTSFHWDSYSPEEMSQEIDWLKASLEKLTVELANLTSDVAKLRLGSQSSNKG